MFARFDDFINALKILKSKEFASIMITNISSCKSQNWEREE